MKLLWIRHGKTRGNEQGRYIGCTDEVLCEAGRAQILQGVYEAADVVYASPMKRCIQTAELIYPGQEIQICPGLEEMNFGLFEGKNYQELCSDAQYQSWIDSMGQQAIPGGEDKNGFCRRCIHAFETVMQKHWGTEQTVAFVVHGGTIMAIMEQYGLPEKTYYDWHIENGQMLVCEEVAQTDPAEQRKLQVIEPKAYFPMFFDLTDKKILVAGGGQIATRRIVHLLEFGAQITVIAPEISETLQKLVQQKQITVQQRCFQKEDVEGYFWIIAATDSRTVNREIGRLAKQQQIFCTVSDCKEESDVYFPGLVHKDNLVIGITASGQSHAQVKRIRKACEDIFREEKAGVQNKKKNESGKGEL